MVVIFYYNVSTPSKEDLLVVMNLTAFPSRMRFEEIHAASGSKTFLFIF